MPGQFNDRVALVTGAASGIGRASALAFARESAKVIVSDIESARGEETVSLIKEKGGQAQFIPADVSKASDVKALVDKTIGVYGRLDFAHNNAGIEGAKADIADSPEESWDRIIDINLKGVWLCMKYEIPEMLKNKAGAIVNTASAAGLVGWSKFAPYSASKHGVIGLTKTAAIEYMKSGIRVNAVCPGLIDNEMVQRAIIGEPSAGNAVKKVFQDVRKSIGRSLLSQKQPSGRMGLSEEVAEAVLWLCSSASSYVNGHALVVDGGMLAK